MTQEVGAEKVGAAGDETNEWSWVDEAVPRGVAELAAAVDERRRQAAQLAAAMHPSDPAAASAARMKLDGALSLALGACEVTPLEMAAAYNTVASRGIYSRPHLVQRVRDRKRRVVCEGRVRRLFPRPLDARLLEARLLRVEAERQRREREESD